MIFTQAALLALILSPPSLALAHAGEGEKKNEGVKMPESPNRVRGAQRSLIDISQPVSYPSPCEGLPAGRTGWTQVMAPNDDSSTGSISLPFTFNFYGQAYTSLFINNNGNLSFDAPYSTFTASGFPVTAFPMVAPFWADVDTRNVASGLVWAKNIGTNKFAVAWDQVGYFFEAADKLNTFQVIISDGTDPSMGLGNNICFCYQDMAWTTGSFSGGSNGFGGVAATVGANKGDGISFFQVGRFDQPGSAYDGANNNNDGVDYLDGQSICFNAGSANIPPIATNVPPGNRLDLACDETLSNYEITFLAPENDQAVSLSSSGASNGLTVTTATQTNQATATINWAPTTAANVQVTFTASDGIDYTVIGPVTFSYPGPCCAAPSVEIWNPTTDSLVGPMNDGGTYCLRKYNLRVVLCRDAPIVNIKLYNKTRGGAIVHRQTEYFPPYFLWGDNTNTSDVFPNKKALANGYYGLRFTANNVTNEISFYQAC